MRGTRWRSPEPLIHSSGHICNIESFSSAPFGFLLEGRKPVMARILRVPDYGFAIRIYWLSISSTIIYGSDCALAEVVLRLLDYLPRQHVDNGPQCIICTGNWADGNLPFSHSLIIENHVPICRWLAMMVAFRRSH